MTEHQVDVQTFINQNSLAPIQRLVLSLCFLVVAIDGFDTAVIGFLAPAIRAEWGSSQAELTSMMMSGSAGLLVGAFLFGPLSDKYGRRPMLIVTCFVFGAMCLLSGYASSITMLTALRFLTGLGLGGAMPNAITLSTEYSPDHRRASLVTLMFCGFTLGMASAGFIAAAVVPTWGWRSMLLIGGGAPLVLVPVLMAFLPESARFLALTRRGDQKIAAILSRISRDPKLASATFVATETARGAPIKLLFSNGMARGTLLLWMTTFMSLLVVYVVGNWLPLILTDAGLGKEHATLITTGFHLGGVVGGILLGQLMDRFNENKVLAGSYLAAALFIGVVGSSTENIGLLALCVFGAGICVSGTQTGVQALASGFYPTGARATGVSWMNAVGRFGSILGSFAGGVAIALGWDAGRILIMLIGPALLAAFGMYAMALVRRPSSFMV
jgi:AAHS family 4-hydroxybenzoate transporter-like MFS transporter